MRRNSSGEDDRQYIESLADTAAINNGNNVGDLIYRFEKRTGRPDVNAMREVLSSSASQLQPQLDAMLYYNSKNPVFAADMKLSDLQYLRYLQQQDKLRFRHQQGVISDSLLSLTDSEFCSDDQGQDFSHSAKDPYGVRTHNRVVHDLSRFGRFIEMMSRLPLPRMSFTGMGFCFLVAVFISPRTCDEKLIFPAFRLLFGTLYPAYASYKAVRTKNVKEYVSTIFNILYFKYLGESKISRKYFTIYDF